MIEEDNASISHTFMHFPRLVIEGGKVEVLGGALQSLDFSTFERLDSDWAREKYFAATRPACWVRTHEPAEAGDGAPDADAGAASGVSEGKPAESAYDSAVADAMLVYNGLLALTGELYPDPRFSMSYQLCGQAVIRYAGVYERTWLLNGGGFAALPREVLESIAAITAAWHSHGFKHDDRVFAPLRGLASLASAFFPAATGMLPLVVALEGFLLPAMTYGKAENMAKVARFLIGPAAPGDIEEFFRATYDVRSRVIHGKDIPEDEAESIVGGLQRLTGRLVIAATLTMIDRNISPDNFSALQAEWLQP